MNINFSQKVIGIIVIIVALILGIGVYYITSANVNVITVYKDTVEEKIYKTGIVTVYSTPIVAGEGGEALFKLKEGKLVTPYTKLATVYSGVLDDETKERLRALNDKIVFSEALSSTKKYIIGDLTTINKGINDAFSKVMDETNGFSYENVYELKNEILTYNEKALELKGVKIESKPVKSLEDEIAETEKALNYGKKVYTSPINGMFSAKVSNFDELLTPDNAPSLTVKDYNELEKLNYETYTGVTAGKSFCKIINNYEWYLVSKFTKEEIGEMEKGDNISIRILNSSSNTVEGKIHNISEFEDEEAIVIVKSTKHIDGIWTDGKVEFELIKSVKTGIKIPESAVVKKDDKEGVYVIKDSVYKFIEIEPVLRDKNYVIVKDKGVDAASERSNVILYDFVVTNPKNVNEGSIAN